MSDLVKRVSPNYIQELAKSDYKNEYKYLSPVNLKLQYMTKIQLPVLKWLHMDSEPNKIHLANSGQTVVVSGTWQKNRPSISGGPLLTTYKFSQLHYHWGTDNTNGSEHSYNDKKVPLEMHAVFLKESSKNQEDALVEKDGTVVVSYAYKLDDEPNPGIALVCEAIPYIPNPNQLIELEDPVYLNSFISPFQNDYFVYWGSVRTNACKHILLWILCRQPYSINEKQLEIFRQLFTSGHQPIMHNSRYTHFQGYEVFHVNPSAYNADVLYKKTENNKCKVVLTKRKIKELKSRRKSNGRYLRMNRYQHGSTSSADFSSNSAVGIVSSKTKTNGNKSAFEDHLNEAKNKHAVTTHYNVGVVKKGSNTNNINERTKQKLQSYYTKFFSSQDKINKEQNKPFSQIKNNKNNATVMNLIVSNSSDKEFYSEENQITQNTGENHIFEHINNTQIKEQETKNKNEILDINALKYNTHRNEEEIFDFTREGVHKIDTNLLKKIKFSQSTKNLHESWDDYKDLKYDNSKIVTFNNNFNINAEEYESEVHCYRVSSELQTCYPFQNKKNFDETVVSHLHTDENDIKNEIYKDCSDKMAHELNSNESNKVQDVGINTISLNELILSMSINNCYKNKKSNKELNPEDSEGSNMSVTFSKNECIDENNIIKTVICSSKMNCNSDVNDEDLTLVHPKSKHKSHYTSSQSSLKKDINSEKSGKTNSQSKFSYLEKNSSGSSTELSENEQSDTSEDNKIKIRRLSQISIKHSPYSNAERLHQRKKYQPKYKTHLSRANTISSNTNIKSNINGKNKHKSKQDSETSVSTKLSSNKITKPEIQQTIPKKTSITNCSLNESKKSKSSHFCATENEKESLKAKELHMHKSATTLDGKNKYKTDNNELCQRTESGTSQSLTQSNSNLSQENSDTKKHAVTAFKQIPHVCYDLSKKKEEILLASNKSLSNYQTLNNNNNNNTALITQINSLKNTVSNTNNADNSEISGLKAQFSIHQGNLQLLEETIKTKIPSLKTAATVKRQNYLNNAKVKIKPQTVVTSTRRFVTNNLNKLRPKTTPSCKSTAASAIRTGSKGNLTADSTLITANNNTGGKKGKVNNYSGKVPVKNKPVSRAWRY